MKNIAIIPARSGSKTIPDKNIQLLNGKPLMAYTILAAIDSGMFDTVHVSTDDERYAQIARDYGADVPFLRSAEASTDTASSWAVVREVLENYKACGSVFDTFMMLQPTSPLRNAEDVVQAYSVLEQKRADAVVSVCEMDHSLAICNTLPEDGSLVGFLRDGIKTGYRQKLGKSYRLNGAIYLSRIAAFERENNIYAGNCYAYIMDKRHSVDVDDMLDFEFAQVVMNHE